MFVANHLAQWVDAQRARLKEGPRQLPQIRPARLSSLPVDPWEAAIAQARAEIRDLIEAGELDHDQLTVPWIEQWAADIYRDRLVF